MVANIKKSLQSLRKLAPELNRAADDATALVRDIEKALQELDLGVRASVQVLKMEDDEFACLTFKRIGGKFRIAVAIDEPEDDGESWKTVSETPWLECPRDLKLKTFPQLPALLADIETQVQRTVKSITEAGPAVRELLKSLQ
ncbi:MAG: hypothetical protein FJ271_21045 [Planctomycetes bacterium]|nr:hypothetical protein [Planctomycetota bacterium]